MIRINKYLSLCGVTSRRGAEGLIAEGKVTLNNSVLDRQGVVIDEAHDVVKVHGVEVRPVTVQVYVVLNKPPLVMTTLHDPFKRRTVKLYLRNCPQRVYPVGRLDYDTQGVLLLTNNGDLAYRLAHPKYRVPKVYEAFVQGSFGEEAAALIQGGLKLQDGAVGRAAVSILGRSGDMTRIRLTLTEGRKREVKQLCKLAGHPVERLQRVEFAGITVKGLALGAWRHLTQTEVARLEKLVGLP